MQRRRCVTTAGAGVPSSIGGWARSPAVETKPSRASAGTTSCSSRASRASGRQAIRAAVCGGPGDARPRGARRHARAPKAQPLNRDAAHHPRRLSKRSANENGAGATFCRQRLSIADVLGQRECGSLMKKHRTRRRRSGFATRSASTRPTSHRDRTRGAAGRLPSSGADAKPILIVAKLNDVGVQVFGPPSFEQPTSSMRSRAVSQVSRNGATAPQRVTPCPASQA